MAKGHGNALTTALGRAIGLVARAFGRGNSPGMANSRGNGAAHGRGFGFSHASVGNPGHNALSARSSHSQNTSPKNGSHDGGSSSSNSQLGHSLAQDQTVHSTNPDQAMQVGDRGPDSVQPGTDPEADPAKAFNPQTIHSDPSDVSTLGVQFSQLPTNNGGGLIPDTIHSGLYGFVIGKLTSGLELQTDPSGTSDPDTIGSDIDITVTRGLASVPALNLDRSEFLQASEKFRPGWVTILQDTEDTPATLLPDIEKYRPRKVASVGNELNGPDEANAARKLVPFYVVAVLLVFPLLLALKTL
jgi:hypothetical protein